MTQDDLPNEFWIVLSGEVGIFPPRLDEIVHRETKIFEKIKHALGYPLNVPIENIDAETLYVAADFSKLDAEDREFLSNIRRIENDYIKFKHNYLLKKLGDLPDKVTEGHEMFNHVHLLDHRSGSSSSRRPMSEFEEKCSEKLHSSTGRAEMLTVSL